MRALKITSFLFATFLIGCGYFGEEIDESWVKDNLSSLDQLAEEILSIEGLASVSGVEPYTDNTFNRFEHHPSESEIDTYNNLQKKLESLAVRSVSVLPSELTVSFVFYDSGVFGDSYQSVVYSKRPDIATELNTPEVFKCKALSNNTWHICEGVN